MTLSWYWISTDQSILIFQNTFRNDWNYECKTFIKDAFCLNSTYTSFCVPCFITRTALISYKDSSNTSINPIKENFEDWLSTLTVLNVNCQSVIESQGTKVILKLNCVKKSRNDTVVSVHLHICKEVCNGGVACSLLKLDGGWQATPSITKFLRFMSYLLIQFN